MLEIVDKVVLDNYLVFTLRYHGLKIDDNFCSIYQRAILVAVGKPIGLKLGIIDKNLIICIIRVLYEKRKEPWLPSVIHNHLTIDYYAQHQDEPLLEGNRKVLIVGVRGVLR